jgi:cell division protein FtsZ
MIELTRTHELHSDWRVKVLGVGGAGTHAVDRLNRDGLSGVELMIANTDVRALSAAFTTDRVSLGQSVTRGLGAGGDPELGRTATLESIATVGERLSGASLVVLMVGLGGGTGSGGAPCIAQIARAQGANVVVFATLPFSFEGRRRREQALEALDALEREADMVVCFENDRMSSVADPANGIEDAFQAVDSLLAQAVRAMASMTRRRSVLHSGLDEIAATVSGYRCTALFGYGAADGEERARAAVARAFANPLLNFDAAAASIRSLWVHVAGGPDMRFSEMQNLMQEVTSRVPQDVRLYLGAAVDPQMGGAVSVTLLAGIPSADVRSEVVTQPSVAQYAVPAETRPAPQVLSHAVAMPSGEEASWQPASVRDPEPVLAPAPEPETFWEQEPSRSQAAAVVVEDFHEAPAARVPESLFEVEIPVQPVSEPVVQPEPVSPPSRGVPIPPFELSKERRREAASVSVQPVNTPSHVETDWNAAAPAQVVTSSETALPFEPEVAPVHDPAPPVVAPQVHEPVAPETQEPSRDSVVRKAKENVQEQMRFEPVNRGRFEKTDPTIVDGEDFDVPTFMRQGVSLEP